MRRRRGGDAAAALAFVLAGCRSSHGQTAEAEAEPIPVPTVAVATVLARPVEATVRAQGTLASGEGASVKIAPTIAARVVSVAVREGDRVARGQVVALLDSRAEQAQATSARAALAAAQAEAAQAGLAARASATDQQNAVRVARLGLVAAREDRDEAVRQAHIALETAQADLRQTRSGARPQEIAQAAQAVRSAQATQDQAAIRATRLRALLAKGFVAASEVDDAQAALSVAEASLTSAREQENLVRAGARPEERRTAELRVQAARAALVQARASGVTGVARAEAALQQATQSALGVAASVQEARARHEAARARQADLQAARTTAGNAVLRAPLGGVVTRRAGDPGDMADPAVALLEVADTRTLDLLADLPAGDGARVRAGMPVRLHVPDRPGQTFPGRVRSVGQVDPQTNLLRVRVAIANPTRRLSVGTFAQADIVVARHARARVVPKAALLTREDGQTVLFTVGADSVAHEHEVGTGAEQNGLIEITRGDLASGARVIRVGQYELEDGQKVNGAAAAGGKDAETGPL